MLWDWQRQPLNLSNYTTLNTIFNTYPKLGLVLSIDDWQTPVKTKISVARWIIYTTLVELVLNRDLKDSKTRTTTKMRFDIQLFVYSQKNRYPGKRHCSLFFLPEKLTRWFLLKEVKPSPDRKIIKLITFYSLVSATTTSCFRLRSRMTSVIAFSRQNDAGSRAHNLVLRKSRTHSRLCLRI